MAPLRALVAGGHEIVMVVSQPDRKRGRGGAMVPSPVKAAALALGLPVSDGVDDVLGRGAELGVVVAFGKLVRPHVLAELPMVNVHFSLLPRWRGAAPVERAILAGDERAGVCIMGLEAGLDTGPVYACREVEIGAEATAAELRAELVEIGTELLLGLLREGAPAPASAVPQVGEATYAKKLEPGEHRLDWKRPAAYLFRVVRLGQAWTTFRGKRVKVLKAVPVPGVTGFAPGEIYPKGLAAGTGDGALRMLLVQPEGKSAQPFADWLNGARLRAGERFV